MIIKKTLDGFLNGELKVYQLEGGYRAGHDAVILASSINAKEGDSCLELGIGSGVVSLCLAHRVKGIKIIGLENNNNMIEISNQSISLNHYEKIIKVLDFDIEGDIKKIKKLKVKVLIMFSQTHLISLKTHQVYPIMKIKKLLILEVKKH